MPKAKDPDSYMSIQNQEAPPEFIPESAHLKQMPKSPFQQMYGPLKGHIINIQSITSLQRGMINQALKQRRNQVSQWNKIQEQFMNTIEKILNSIEVNQITNEDFRGSMKEGETIANNEFEKQGVVNQQASSRQYSEAEFSLKSIANQQLKQEDSMSVSSKRSVKSQIDLIDNDAGSIILNESVYSQKDQINSINQNIKRGNASKLNNIAVQGLSIVATIDLKILSEANKVNPKYNNQLLRDYKLHMQPVRKKLHFFKNYSRQLTVFEDLVVDKPPKERKISTNIQSDPQSFSVSIDDKLYLIGGLGEKDSIMKKKKENADLIDLQKMQGMDFTGWLGNMQSNFTGDVWCWEEGKQMKLFARLKTPCGNATCCAIGYFIYVIGGYGRRDKTEKAIIMRSCQRITAREEVDPLLRVKEIAPMNFPSENPCICKFGANFILKIGGDDDVDMELYSIIENKWTVLELKGDLNHYKGYCGAVMVEMQRSENKIIILGGMDYEKRKLILSIDIQAGEVLKQFDNENEGRLIYSKRIISEPIVQGDRVYAVDHRMLTFSETIR